MTITFISLIEDVYIPSLRYLSAYLKAEGHAVKLILLPWGYSDKSLHAGNSFRYPYPREVLDQVGELCKDSKLIGLSLMTCHFDNAVHVTNYLRQRFSTPIIWGGIHPTLRPEECLNHADMVCVGEGELSVSRLAAELEHGQSWQAITTPGILKRSDVPATSITPGPLLEDLNQIPLPDYDPEHHFILYAGRIVRLDGHLLAHCFGGVYQAMFSRGCPYPCTYCCNNALRTLYGRKLPVRWRTVENMIRELKVALEFMPDLRVITLSDDAFLVQSLDKLTDFATQYKNEIHRPFFLLTTPRSVDEHKLSLMMDAGLYHIAIGIQSGSERIYKGLYARPESLADILATSRCIHQVARKLNKQIMVRYDIILDNPWENDDDLEASIRHCTQLEKPYNLALFSLTLYPGTALYARARKEGLITDDLNQIYRASQLVVKRTYFNSVFAVVAANAPTWVITALLSRPLRRWNQPALPLLVALGFDLLKMARGFFGFAIRGEWSVIKMLFKQALVVLLSKLRPRKAAFNRPLFSGAPGQCRAQEVPSPT